MPTRMIIPTHGPGLKGVFTALLLLMVDRNIVLYENEKFTKTDSQLPIDPDPWA